MLTRLCLLKKVKPSGDRKMITFDKFVSVTSTRGTMTKAITFSRSKSRPLSRARLRILRFLL